MDQSQVLISGAGPVGLTLALLLTKKGIPCTLIEKHPGTSIHPKARGVNARSMEIFRALDVEQAIISHELSKKARRFLWAESITGEIVGEVTLDECDENHSPCQPCFVTQDLVEQELLKKLQQEPLCEILFAHKALKTSQEDNQIYCVIENIKTNQQRALEAQFFVCAEGAHSQTREQLGIQMQGIENLGSSYSVYAEFSEKPAISGKEAIVMVLTGKEYRSRFVMAVDLDKRWMVMIPEALIDASEKDENYPTKLCQYVMQCPNSPVTIHSTSTWEMAGLNASRYQDGRIFLVGDAAHRIPPTGGMGMNTGIQDAHNLAWKLARVLQNKESATLLSSYETERKPIAQATIDWSIQNAERIHSIFSAIEKGDENAFAQLLKLQKKQLHHPGLDFGYNYLCPDETDTDIFLPKITAGVRLPHFSCSLQGKEVSSLALIDNDYLLITKSETQIKSLEKYHAKVLILGKDMTTDSELLSEVSAVLVRPDGFVSEVIV